MTVKIDNSVKSVGGLPTGEVRVRKPDASAAAAGGDKVELSSLSSQLAEAEKLLANVPVVDEARVNEIKLAISEGRFKVDSEKVADGLVESVRRMLDAQRQAN